MIPPPGEDHPRRSFCARRFFARSPVLAQSFRGSELVPKNSARRHGDTDNRNTARIRRWSARFGKQPASHTRHGAFNSLRLGLAQMDGNRYCEDRYDFDELFVAGRPLFLLSVFDGHGGWQVAHYLERELLPTVRRNLGEQQSCENKSASNNTHDPDVLSGILTKSYHEVDENLKKRIAHTIQLGFDRFVRVGSCACTVAITDSHYVVANAGDCRAILCRGGEVLALSEVQNADNATERERIRSMRPSEPDAVECDEVCWLDPKTDLLYDEFRPGRERYEMGCYVKGVLQPTRAFGDFALKCAELNISFEVGLL